jgi:hypothetical protein
LLVETAGTGMGGAKGHGRAPYRKLSAEDRARFLEVLRDTGNRKAAAEAIGVEPRLMDQRREHDPELDREWEAAAEEAHRRLSAANGPFDSSAMPQKGRAQGNLNMIKRGKKGRLQLVAAGKGRWTAEVEETFKAELRENGNVRASAHAVGFSEGAVWQRRRNCPAFAEAMEEMLEEAELRLEFRMAAMGGNALVGEERSSVPGIEPDATLPTPTPSLPGRGEAEKAAEAPFDMDQALRFLKWREEKRRGRRRTPRAKLPSIEDVTEKIVRRVEAIKRHRRRQAGK